MGSPSNLRRALDQAFKRIEELERQIEALRTANAFDGIPSLAQQYERLLSVVDTAKDDKERWQKEKVELQNEIAELRRQLGSQRQGHTRAIEDALSAAEGTRQEWDAARQARDAARQAVAERAQREGYGDQGRAGRAQAEAAVQAQDQRRRSATPPAPAPSPTGDGDDGLVYIHDDPEQPEESEVPEPTPQPARNANGKRPVTAGKRKGPKKPKLSETAPYDEGAIVYYPSIETGNDTALLSSFAGLSNAVRRGWDRFSKKNRARVEIWLRNRTPGYCVLSYTMSMRPSKTTEEGRACQFCVNNGYPCVVSTEGTPDMLLLPAPSSVGDEKAGYSFIK